MARSISITLFLTVLVGMPMIEPHGYHNGGHIESTDVLQGDQITDGNSSHNSSEHCNPEQCCRMSCAYGHCTLAMNCNESLRLIEAREAFFILSFIILDNFSFEPFRPPIS